MFGRRACRPVASRTGCARTAAAAGAREPTFWSTPRRSAAPERGRHQITTWPAPRRFDRVELILRSAAGGEPDGTIAATSLRVPPETKAARARGRRVDVRLRPGARVHRGHAHVTAVRAVRGEMIESCPSHRLLTTRRSNVTRARRQLARGRGAGRRQPGSGRADRRAGVVGRGKRRRDLTTFGWLRRSTCEAESGLVRAEWLLREHVSCRDRRHVPAANLLARCDEQARLIGHPRKRIRLP